MGGSTFEYIEAKIVDATGAPSCIVPTPPEFNSTASDNNVDVDGLVAGCEYEVELVAFCFLKESSGPLTRSYCTCWSHF